MKFRWAYLAGLVGAVFGAATLVLSPEGGLFKVVVAGSLALAGLVVLARDTRELRADASDLYAVDTGPEGARELRLTDTYGSFEFEDFRDLRALVSWELNRLLPKSSIPVRYVEERYSLPRAARRLQPFLLREAFRSGAVLFNQEKVRLSSDLTPQRLLASEPLVLQRTDYFAGLVTNELALKQIRSRETNAIRFSGSELVGSNGQILDLNQSLNSNHIGIATLALTSDGQLVFTVQARGSAQSANLLAPSGSGSADLSDLEAVGGDDLTAFLTFAMERELGEECGLGFERSDTRTVVLGYARLLMRGGKPEFFGLTKVGEHSSALTVPGKEAVFISDVLATRISRDSVKDFQRSLRYYCEAHERSFSLPLHLHLLFLERFVDEHPDLFAEMLV